MGTSLSKGALACLIVPSLQFLAIPWGDKTSVNQLSDKGRVPNLSTIYLTLACMDADAKSPQGLSRFLEANSQMTSLTLSYIPSVELLSSAITALHSSRKLKGISLSWRGDDIPSAFITELSHLPQVETLHINAAFAVASPRWWFVNHDEVRRSLRGLTSLKRLIIQGDTYPLVEETEHRWFTSERYYDYRKPRNEFWIMHEDRMHEHALEYVRLLPNLEFIHIGQVLYTVERIHGSRSPVVTGSAWCGDPRHDIFKEEFGFTEHFG
ncbi:hypothetical protein F5Y16DRAFT_84627 [Xylariaceae sp. FL0255]|nr:hypothetical protein F5Y16DRAFT_84627 [Xylariaceae sp. FL0255]